MQLLADVSGRPVHVPDSELIPARGAALFGAVAAGVYASIDDAITATRPADAHVYGPRSQATKTYDRVYPVYRRLYEILGQSEVGLLHALKRIRSGKEE
jgi:L-ribulokinase